MTRIILAALAVAASLVQASALSTLFLTPTAAPLLPVAVLAAWGAMRGPDEVWPALLLAPLPLGVVSEERAGWFLLALLPTAALLLDPSPPETLRKLGRAPLAAALGAVAYLAVLFLAAGEIRDIPNSAGIILGAAAMTAAIACVLALLLWPVRTRRAPGLFR